MIKLSKASKMPCKSWSLEAIDTCPGSIEPSTGELVQVCKGCYATTGNYNFPNVKKPRIHNKEDWKRDEWIDDMVNAIKKDPYFRWFDSGDMYDLRLVKKIHKVIKLTPNTQHWLPTRMYKFTKFITQLTLMSKEPNLSIRLSSDTIDAKIKENNQCQDSVVISDREHNYVECTAYQREGKCGPCRLCWDKSIETIAYPAHGKKMSKIIARSS